MLKLVPAAINLLVDDVNGYFPIVNWGSSTTIILSTWTEVVPWIVIMVPTGTFEGIIVLKVIPDFISLNLWKPALNMKVQGEEYWDILPEALYN